MSTPLLGNRESILFKKCYSGSELRKAGPFILGILAGALLGHGGGGLDELGSEVGPPADGAEDGRVAEHDGEVRRQLHHDDLAPEGVRGTERMPTSVSCRFIGTSGKKPCLGLTLLTSKKAVLVILYVFRIN